MAGFAYSGGPLADRPQQVHSMKVYLVGEGHWPAGAYIRNADGILVWREHGDYIPVDEIIIDGRTWEEGPPPPKFEQIRG